jgi:hypothetical protein
MVDGFNMTVPLLLQLIVAVLVILALATFNSHEADDDDGPRQAHCDLLFGVSPFCEAPSGNRFARAAVLPSEARGLPPDAIHSRRRRSVLF